MTEICTASPVDVTPTSRRVNNERSLASSGREAVKRLSSEMMASSLPKPSPAKIAKSPNIAISKVDSPEHAANSLPTIASTVHNLLPNPLSKSLQRRESDGDRYYTASSGEEDRYYDDYDDDLDDDEDDGMCIMLESDDDDGDTGSLSGLHINLKTLQAVSNMLAHYTPIIQRDINGNPFFVAPPPPPLAEYSLPEMTLQDSPKTKPYKLSRVSESSPHTSTGDDVSNDYQIALQELENVITAEEDTFLVDKMSELTDVMEKMTHYSSDESSNK